MMAMDMKQTGILLIDVSIKVSTFLYHLLYKENTTPTDIVGQRSLVAMKPLAEARK